MKLGLSILVFVAGIVLISCNSTTKQSATKPVAQLKKPNVLIIQPDQHRADVMGCAGDKMVKTPNLDKLAANGVHFTHAASASPVCCPFRATMQTGLYIHEHGVVENGIQLDYELKGIAEIFAENGYATGYIGKWHLEGFLPKESVGGYVPEGAARQGWQEWYGYEKSHEFLEVWKFNDKKEKVPVEGYDWEPTWHTDMALDFIKRKTEDGKPWCYYLAYGPPHKPEQCLPKFLEMYDPEAFELPADADKHMSDDNKKKLRKVLQMYYAQVTAVDVEIGRIQNGLKELGVDDNTIIIYVSDHGDVLGSNNREIVKKYVETKRNLSNTIRTKGKPFSTAFRIPLIIKTPNIKQAGLKTDALVSSVDLVPTILDLSGIPVPEYMQGISMADWITKADGPKQPYIYLGLHNDKNAWRAVWDGKYMLSMLDYKLFYDYNNDPFETDNLYSNLDSEAKKKEYETALINLAEKTGDPILPRLKNVLTK
jgi:arylsulfatase A-like enzyme